MGRLFYFRAPNFDINADGDIAPRLGSIFSCLDHLISPLNQFDRLPIPESLLNESHNTDFHETDDKSFRAEASLNANAFQAITGSADVVYTFARDKNAVYHCEELQTLEFEPDRDFVAGSIAASLQVQTFLDDCPFGFKKIYMVTGLKIASGFSKSCTKDTEHGPSLKVGVSATAFGMPMEAGPGLGALIFVPTRESAFKT
ncbi:hypothetical protein CSPX01_17288 [Colletotrichum filicis]|nr:hypothetical protein CSPX01_17288 [Colletotrichum filicis]